MESTEVLIAILAFFGVPTALTGFFVWLMQRRITRRDKQKAEEEARKATEQEERERKEAERAKRQEDMQMLMMQSIRSCVILSEATARAVQRIPSAKCNGDMTKALRQVAEIQGKQKQYIMDLGLHAIYEHDVSYAID